MASVTGTGKAVGCEADHLTMERAELLTERQMLQYRTFDYRHSVGILSRHYGREAALVEPREDIDTVQTSGTVTSIEPVLTFPKGCRGRAAIASMISSS